MSQNVAEWQLNPNTYHHFQFSDRHPGTLSVCCDPLRTTTLSLNIKQCFWVSQALLWLPKIRTGQVFCRGQQVFRIKVIHSALILTLFQPPPQLSQTPASLCFHLKNEKDQAWALIQTASCNWWNSRNNYCYFHQMILGKHPLICTLSQLPLWRGNVANLIPIS